MFFVMQIRVLLCYIMETGTWRHMQSTDGYHKNAFL